MDNPASTTPMRDLRSFLNSFAGRCREMGWLRPLAHVRASMLLQSDAAKAQAKAAAIVYTEEQRNLLNASELDVILADGAVSSDELPKLSALRSRERKSAAKLHDVAEALA